MNLPSENGGESDAILSCETPSPGLQTPAPCVSRTGLSPAGMITWAFDSEVRTYGKNQENS